MDIAVAKMKGKGYPAHQVWLPPLETPDTFATLMPDLRESHVAVLEALKNLEEWGLSTSMR